MKKVLLSIALVVAISLTSSVVAQEAKKEACPQKTECAKKCCKSDEKKCSKLEDKKCCKSEADKKCCKSEADKKCCKSSNKETAGKN